MAAKELHDHLWTYRSTKGTIVAMLEVQSLRCWCLVLLLVLLPLLLLLLLLLLPLRYC